MQARVTVKAGVCGFTTVIVARSEDMQNVSFQIESDCKNILGFAEGFPMVDAYSEVGAGFDGAVYQAVRGSLKGCCTGCIVPCGIFKAMQVAAGVALPAAAAIEMVTE